jgi:hypothetical protein
MEDVLETYQRPRDADRPLVCLDETSKTSKQLIAETRAPISMSGEQIGDPFKGHGGPVAIPTFSTGEASGRKGAWNQRWAVEGLHYMAGCDC